MGKRNLSRAQRSAVVKLVNALNDVTDGTFGKPSIMQGDGWDTVTVCWDGPYEWTMITAGSTVFCGESGKYSTPTEPKIAEALTAIKDAGIFLEPINSGQLGCYDI